jgi:RsiW-degrading membrane proteinase PrsW (M82 family)
MDTIFWLIYFSSRKREKPVPQADVSFTFLLTTTCTFHCLYSKINSHVEYEQRILISIVAYAIIVYQYIRNLSNNFTSCCEASDIYREK